MAIEIVSADRPDENEDCPDIYVAVGRDKIKRLTAQSLPEITQKAQEIVRRQMASGYEKPQAFVLKLVKVVEPQVPPVAEREITRADVEALAGPPRKTGSRAPYKRDEEDDVE